MTPKDMSYTERLMRDLRWSQSVNFGSPMSSWTPTMHAVSAEMGWPKTPEESLAQTAEVRRRDALAR